MPEHSIALHAGSLADTHAIAGAVAELSRPGDIIVLAGEMGAGKTAFAQGFGVAVGVTDRVTSPTFTLVHSYPIESGPRAGKATLHHADLYRLDRTSEVADLALRELAEYGGIVLIEWGDVVDVFGDHLVVRLEPHRSDPADADAADDDSDVLTLDGQRDLEIGAVGTGWAGRWQSLLEAVEGYRC
ncbi:tRNA (adenosine(37)-N6)-threonylcarbamoyltransferase complex ATPase subunit type 1 TsaE [Ilumatobacter nonamiensis]|uniref:tRNA (adenosine(37)-N6)-threonylcarbamoyltransferase complex ATPase subunit type 1 TsaE n=1 Tax=Ilumatobacter nonamiensis TaxID=467093 RepID=UPI00034D8D9C|nr:tRNA (adenosine(37)-N6)-threonylcarbamoyltransferase complex ATPase subunit type 1 TsaE [Ilumatobacter nonamiensis]